MVSIVLIDLTTFYSVEPVITQAVVFYEKQNKNIEMNTEICK